MMANVHDNAKISANSRTAGLRCLFFVLSVAFVSLRLSAQDVLPDQEIRRQSQQILSEPEFRYFEHLGGSSDRPESRDGQTSSSAKDGTGSSGSPSGKRASKSRSRSSKARNRPSESNSNDHSNRSSTSSSWENGLGAIGNVVGLIFHGLAYLVLLVVCGLILFLIIQAMRNRESSPRALNSPLANFDLPQEEDHPPGELPADAYRTKAHELAQQGNYREAIGQLLWGGMSSIERAELIRHRRGLTLRDYLRSLRGKKSHYDGFKSMIRLYEPVGFGRRVASHQTFQDALSGYEQAVNGLM